MPPPGLSGPAQVISTGGGACASPPGPHPPGLGVEGSPAVALPSAEPNADIGQDIMVSILDQVKLLLAQARRDSEAKVKNELSSVNEVIQVLDQRLDAMITQLDDAEAPQVVEQHTVAQALAKVEQQWGKELGKLKQELHQTIFAHNHNADLMKHQKESIDEIRAELEKLKPPSPERIKLAKAHLQKTDQLLNSQQRQRRLEPLFQRLAVLERRLAMGWR